MYDKLDVTAIRAASREAQYDVETMALQQSRDDACVEKLRRRLLTLEAIVESQARTIAALQKAVERLPIAVNKAFETTVDTVANHEHSIRQIEGVL